MEAVDTEQAPGISPQDQKKEGLSPQVELFHALKKGTAPGSLSISVQARDILDTVDKVLHQHKS